MTTYTGANWSIHTSNHAGVQRFQDAVALDSMSDAFLSGADTALASSSAELSQDLVMYTRDDDLNAKR